MSNQLDEKILIKNAVNGDQNAMAILVESHSAPIYSLAIKMLQNEEDAEDILQETFIIMIKKLNTFSGKSSLYTWLYRIATNLTLGKLRSKTIVNQDSDINNLSESSYLGKDIRKWINPIEEEQDQSLMKSCLEQAISKLPESYRSVFIMRDVEKNSTRQTAEILGLSEANVKVRLMRARLYMRDRLAENMKCVDVIPS
ncbi:MAG: sigma-70 family RNA polymerase sigma factor [Candidatus Marinimicrobia bacterium]|jgi:RNA polymerase sigma-70 factor (ECF subfamily)|nr:sigma-70 family RNA polymerase sigma factor [Candidatus Neomarinimicrobiota bacterium]MBT3936373.1 sigma-70 family RNA polymerase sigma factor [Candidatus Neomarinimicrobiota bacterium]MBT3960325.1 sigma-70 family RNA polymerase sigma factor [Candidatus Neomarinimicrobiota bacterium]MBT4383413.1 sigma-70 family RNA polymerase sigma factor [Candidatus Neomarinimicrobiota bacterium]MBT4635426.1 sigma-70 family RNA polymerase sigma factor [Candidatus Neomarinimicrobiota bacterium]